MQMGREISKSTIRVTAFYSESFLLRKSCAVFELMFHVYFYHGHEKHQEDIKICCMAKELYILHLAYFVFLSFYCGTQECICF